MILDSLLNKYIESLVLLREKEIKETIRKEKLESWYQKLENNIEGRKEKCNRAEGYNRSLEEFHN